MGRKREIQHIEQIITNKTVIIDYMRSECRAVAYNTVLLLAFGKETPDYELRLFALCSDLYYLSRLVYAGKSGISKPGSERYIKGLFEPHAETKDEIRSILEYWSRPSGVSFELSSKSLDVLFIKLTILEKIWARFLSSRYEQAYIEEFAYAFEYVLSDTDGKIAEPEYKNEFSLFPSNYENFDYTEGIAELFLTVSKGY